MPFGGGDLDIYIVGFVVVVLKLTWWVVLFGGGGLVIDMMVCAVWR